MAESHENYIRRTIGLNYAYWQPELLSFLSSTSPHLKSTPCNDYHQYLHLFTNKDMDYLQTYNTMVNLYKYDYGYDILKNTLNGGILSSIPQLTPSNELLKDVENQLKNPKILEVLNLLNSLSSSKNEDSRINQYGDLSKFLINEFGAPLIKANKSKRKKSRKALINVSDFLYIDIEGFNLLFEVILYTYLSRSDHFHKFIHNFAFGPIQTLTAWFRGFRNKHSHFIISFRDLFFVEDLKIVRGIRKNHFWEDDQIRENIFNHAWNGNYQKVRSLLLQGYDVDARNGRKKHNGLIHIASEKGDFELINLLKPF